MKLLRILSAATILASGVAAAQAADLTYEPAPVVPAAAPVGSWTGFYVGGSVGYAWGKTDQKDGDFGPITDNPGDIKPDGFIAGLQIGGDYQFPSNVVIGALVDLYYSDAKDTFHSDVFDYSTESKIRYFGTGRVRAGYAIDKFLPYVTGGFAWANNEINDSDWGSDSQTHFGWTAGAGVEYAFTQNWTVKAEYLYSDFGSKTYHFPDSDGAYDVGLKSQTATVGVNYRF
ncbi:MAG: porin family protein [Candidatus Kaistia colombiensis]|nr:MAG: porin family protein [Kaistia sp.]